MVHVTIIGMAGLMEQVVSEVKFRTISCSVTRLSYIL
jgi:hypothetical protein